MWHTFAGHMAQKNQSHRLTVTLIRDYPEDGWISMELYADILAQELKKKHGDALKIIEVTPFRWISHYIPKSFKFARYFMRYIILPLGCLFLQSDIYHVLDQSNAHLLHFLPKGKTIITCHDLIVPFWTDTQTIAKPSYLKKIQSFVQHWRIRSLHKAGHIIAVSKYTKGELIQQLQIPKEKISVVYNTIESYFQPTSTYTGRTQPPRLPQKYVLHVGTNADYKNIPLLLSVFSTLRRDNPSLILVKVGAPWTREQNTLIHTLQIESSIMYLGYIPRHFLPYVYTHARCLIFPSLIEGFGLPVLEAMSCGCPVAISDSTSLREIGGEHATLIDLTNPARGIARIQQILSRRSVYSQSRKISRMRAMYFSQTVQISKLYSVYTSIAKKQLPI